MPRLPTMRVMGSQFSSTRFRFLAGVPVSGSVIVAIFVILSLCSFARRSGRVCARSGVVAGDEFAAAAAPLGLAIDGIVGNRAQRADHLAVKRERGGRKSRARGFVHKR